MINLLPYILLSAVIILSGCVKSQALKPATSEVKIDEGDGWGFRPQVGSAAFIGADDAWLVTENEGELWRTEDGGKSWDKLPGKVVGGRFMAVNFIDPQQGWAANDEGQIWRTSDGGKTWEFISHPKDDEDNEPPFLSHQMYFIDESHGWLIDAFSLWRTDDGGHNWQLSLSQSNKVQNETWQPTRISFVNRKAGWMSATGGIVHRTRDGGKTWQSQKLISGADETDVFFINERVGWLTGFVSSSEPQPGTRLYRSNDGGERWKQIQINDKNTPINSVCFINEREGWALGRGGSQAVDMRGVIRRVGEMRGVILHTNDGGKSWQEIRIGEKELFFDRIYFVDSHHGWLLASHNVYRTQDGGKSWNTVLKLSPMKITID